MAIAQQVLAGENFLRKNGKFFKKKRFDFKAWDSTGQIQLNRLVGADLFFEPVSSVCTFRSLLWRCRWICSFFSKYLSSANISILGCTTIFSTPRILLISPRPHGWRDPSSSESDSEKSERSCSESDIEDKENYDGSEKSDSFEHQASYPDVEEGFRAKMFNAVKFCDEFRAYGHYKFVEEFMKKKNR